MNEAIGAAVYLVLALAVVVGIRAAFANSERRKKLEIVTAPARSPRAATADNTKAQRQPPRAQHGHALPWVIPTALAPAGTGVETKEAATPNKAISERQEIIELRVDRIVRHLAGRQLGPGPSPSTPPGRPGNHPLPTPSRASGAAGH